jgi:hypothetical protein
MTTQPVTVLVVDDEYACYFDPPARSTGKNPAVQWLETVFTGRWALGTFHNNSLVPGPEYLREMAELIDQADDDDYDSAMIVTRTDYDDPGRWWL